MKDKYKPIIICILLSLFQGFMYFISKLTPFSLHLIEINLDKLIPFIIYFVYLYISWYLMLFIIPYIMYLKDKIIFKKYVISIVISILIVFLIYFFYLITITRPNIVVNSFTSFALKLIYIVDTPVNCLPSMHCLICFMFIYNSLRKAFSTKFKIITIVWSILIILSTLFIKQHAILDVISAFIVSLIIYYIVDKKCS